MARSAKACGPAVLCDMDMVRFSPEFFSSAEAQYALCPHVAEVLSGGAPSRAVNCRKNGPQCRDFHILFLLRCAALHGPCLPRLLHLRWRATRRSSFLPNVGCMERLETRNSQTNLCWADGSKAMLIAPCPPGPGGKRLLPRPHHCPISATLPQCHNATMPQSLPIIYSFFLLGPPVKICRSHGVCVLRAYGPVIGH